MGAERAIRLSFEACPMAIRRALLSIAGDPALAATGPDGRAVTELVLAEVLNNIAEHAYGGRGGPVRLALTARDGRLACRVADRGNPMPGRCLPSPSAPSALPDPAAPPEGGYGLPLIRALTQGLRYRRMGGCNVLVFVIAVDS